MAIQLDRALINQIMAHAQRNPEREVCGLVSTKDGELQPLYPIANVATDAGRLFAMDPRQQIDAMRRMREHGEQLFAIYHSHPHAPAEPSALDLEQAAYPEALYLIISLNTKGVLEMKGYRLQDKRLQPVELELA